jgi:hypothetical protein
MSYVIKLFYLFYFVGDQFFHRGTKSGEWISKIIVQTNSGKNTDTELLVSLHMINE